MRILLGANATLAFLLELALLAAGVAIGLLLPAPLAVRIVVAVVLPALVIVVWGLALAPRTTSMTAVDTRRAISRLSAGSRPRSKLRLVNSSTSE